MIAQLISRAKSSEPRDLQWGSVVGYVAQASSPGTPRPPKVSPLRFATVEKLSLGKHRLRCRRFEQHFAVDFDFYVALVLADCFEVYFYAKAGSVGSLN